jgi:hypothetical protein
MVHFLKEEVLSENDRMGDAVVEKYSLDTG